MSISNISYSNMVQTMQAAQAIRNKSKATPAPMVGEQHDDQSNNNQYIIPQDVSVLPETMELQTGETLFYEGDPSGCAFYIEQGRMEVSVQSAGETHVIGHANKGEIVGELGVIVSSPRSASVKATEYTVVRVVHSHVLEDMIATATPGVKALMTTLVKRLRNAAMES